MESAQGFWQSMTRRRRWSLMGGVVAILALAGGLAWWAMTPRYAVLFSHLREANAAEIAGALDTMQVPHRFADGGSTLLVPEDTVYDTRMKLVAQNIPHGSSVGFEVFKDSDFGVTEFAQQVNYQRALQGELERTIATIAEVETARVHLTLHRASMFEEKEAPAKASVSLTLRPGSSLAPTQVVGIQRLVASAVEGLDAGAVVVLGEGGAVLAGGGHGDGIVADDGGTLETRLRQRVDALLRESLGGDAVYSVSVDVRLNYDRIKHVRDTLVPQGQDGNGLVMREKSSGARATNGIDAQGNHTSVPGGGDVEREFAHSREQDEVEVAPGKVERISVGVLLPPSVDAVTVTKLHDVIGAAVGLDVSRGDQLTIMALPAHAIGTTTPTARPSSSVTRPMYADPFWWGVAGVVLGVGVVGAAAGVFAARSRRPARLTVERRAELLADIRRWMHAPEDA